MTTTNLTLYGSNARQISPAVVNLFQANNNVDSLEFQMENYQQENVDLSTLDAYAICYGTEFLGGLDEVKLTSEVTEDGILRIYWDLTLMTLTESQTITYQIVFKGADGTTWTSYKAILFCNESLTADEEIVAQYPTILKQMEGRVEAKSDEIIENINNIAENFDASVVYVPYGEEIPVEERLANRLYYLYTDEGHTKGRFEDSKGTILSLDPTGYATHVGQTIFSLLPIPNAGLHLLDGAKFFGDGVYGGFVEYIAKLYNAGTAAACFTDEVTWQQSVVDYGVCGKFVYNREENSVRLPKVTGIVEGTIDASALGDLVEAGLPNITGQYGRSVFGAGYVSPNTYADVFTGVFKGVNIGTSAGITSSQTSTSPQYIEFDASNSNPIYSNSDTVQPQTIKGYYYIVIATSVTDEVNITNEIELNNPYSLFDSKRSNHDINNISWLKSNGSYHSGAVYVSAYNELLSEYYSPDAVDDGITSTWSQPATTDVATPDGGGNIVCSASSENGNNLAWWALDSFMLGTDSWISANNVTSGWWQVKFPYKLKIKGLTFYSSHSSTYGSKDCRFYTSSAMTTPIGDDFVGKSSGFAATTVTGIPEEGIVTDTLYLNITSSHGTGIGMGHLEIEAERVDVFFKRTPKGYEITTSDFDYGSTDGNVVDYYYVIDTANETFRLPLLDGNENLPSDRYEELELQPSGASYLYTAPANGFVYINKGVGSSTGDSLFVTLANKTKGYQSNVFGGAVTTNNIKVTLPVTKGDEFYVLYSVNGTTNDFKFIYAQGNGSLYFYVGETVQNANLINAGRIEEKLVDKVDINAGNLTADGKSLIGGFGMPSSKYIDLTLGATGTNYTAPANGWFALRKLSTAASQSINLYNTMAQCGFEVHSTTSNQGLMIMLPVSKGQVVKSSYSAGGTLNHFRFIYAEGEV